MINSKQRPQQAWQKLKDAFFGGFIALIVAVVLPVLFRDFRERLAHYPTIDLAGCVTIFGVVLALDYLFMRFAGRSSAQSSQRLMLISVYIIALIIFIIFTLAEHLPKQGNMSPAPLYLGLIVLALGLVVRIPLSGSFIATQTEGRGTGLAATSVLLVGAGNATSFLLILNRNLNNGKGLWVPPGGHFKLGVDNPADCLLRKVQSEVGIEAEIWQPSTALSREVDSFNTAETQWLPAPMFLLDEDLLGLCSHGHTRHVRPYICL